MTEQEQTPDIEIEIENDAKLLRMQRKKESQTKWLEKNKTYFKDYHIKNKEIRGEKQTCTLCDVQIAKSNLTRHKQSSLHQKLSKMSSNIKEA